MRTFDSSILKIDKDGNKVVSSFLDEEAGERLAQDVAVEDPNAHKEFRETTGADLGAGSSSGNPNNPTEVPTAGEPSGVEPGANIAAEGANADGTNLDSSGVAVSTGEISRSEDSSTSEAEKPAQSADRDDWLAYDKQVDPEHHDPSATKKSLLEKYGNA